MPQTLSTREFQSTLVLNYLTAPNVLVRTAVCASCAVSGVFAPVELLAKNAQVRPLDPSPHPGEGWGGGQEDKRVGSLDAS